MWYGFHSQYIISPISNVAMKISWSGCKDSQTSADTVEAGQATGAMSYVSSAASKPMNNTDVPHFIMKAFIQCLSTWFIEDPVLEY